MRIGIIGHNSVEYIETLFSIWNSGHSAVLIDSEAPPSAIINFFEECNVERCYIEESLCLRYENPPPFDLITYPIKYKMPCILPASVRTMYSERRDESEAVIIFSSGTTGKCKGISLSHRALYNNSDSIMEYMKPQSTDCLYLNKKLSHSSSLVGELLVALRSGTDILISSLFIPPRLSFKNISDFGVTILCCNPILLGMFADEAERTGIFPECVRVIYTSGDTISEKAIERARNLFNCPVYNAYGQTECGPRISVQQVYCQSGNSVGKPIRDVSVKLDDCGEILVKTNALFSGYTGLNTIPEEWHRTGDIGYIGTDGELYVIGRVDNMIVIGAHNIYPEVIEKTIVDNTDVYDCMIYKFGDVLACDYVAPQRMDIEIVQVVRSLLIPYEIPKKYRRVDRISRNSNGKKQRVAEEKAYERCRGQR